MNTAIIVAAGSGTRFGSDIPKQFIQLAGKPILIHSLEEFEATTAVDQIIVVTQRDHIEQVKELSVEYRISALVSVVEGGATRSESVLKGLNAVDPATNIVAVHDGARPLVSVHEIDDCVYRAEETGAACLVAEVSDTIKHVEDGEIARTIDRTKLRRALTPQAFKVDILRRAFDEFGADESATDECYLVEKLGVPIACVEGSSRNIKITRPEDLMIAELFLKDFPK